MANKTSFLLRSPKTVLGIGDPGEVTCAEGGINTIGEMLRAGPWRIHSLFPNVEAQEIGKWFCEAMLLRIESIEPSLAAAFVAAGIRTRRKLANAKLEDLEKAAVRAHESDRLPKLPTLYKLAGLQRAAWRLEGTGMMAGRLIDAAGLPLKGIPVGLGNWETETDETGRYAFDQIREGKARIHIQVANRDQPTRFRAFQVRPDKLTGPITQRLFDRPAGYFPAPITDERDGKLVVNMAGTVSKLITLPLAEFREGTYFQLRELGAESARLLSLFKVRIGQTVYVQLTRVSASEVPSGAEPGAILMLSSGALQETGMTLKNIADLKRTRSQETAKRASRFLIRIREK